MLPIPVTSSVADKGKGRAAHSSSVVGAGPEVESLGALSTSSGDCVCAPCVAQVLGGPRQLSDHAETNTPRGVLPHARVLKLSPEVPLEVLAIRGLPRFSWLDTADCRC